jgi:hypothetical protein
MYATGNSLRRRIDFLLQKGKEEKNGNKKVWA